MVHSRESVSGWLRFPRVIALCLGLAVLVSLPGLWMGPFLDDYFHAAILDKVAPFGGPLSLFDFAPGDREALWPLVSKGPFPWFTLPELRIRFFRPLSSALATMDYAAFGRNVLWLHVHSLIWYLLLVAGWAVILRRMLPGPVGALALILFALDPTHWFPVVWPANRNALIAVTLAVWGLCAHIRWREDGWRPGAWLSALLYVAGLLGGESAIGVFAYVFAYEVFAAPGATRIRVRSLLPAAVVGIAYVAVYKLFGCGAYGSGSYIDPLHEPVSYLLHAPGRLLALVGAQLVGFPVDLSVFNLWLRPVQVVVGLVTVVIFAVVMRRAWVSFDITQRRTLTWATSGAAMSLLPVAATFPMGRLLLVASMGASVLVASVLVYWWQQRGQRPNRRLLGVLGWFLVATHLVLPPVAWTAQSLAIGWFSKHAEAACMAAEMGEPALGGRHYVLLVGPEPMTSLYTPIVRAVIDKQWRTYRDTWWAISQAPFEHRVTRTDENRLEIEVLGGNMLGTEFERLFRSARFPLKEGERIKLEGVVVSILEVSAGGPSKIALEFDRRLEDPSLWFLVWKGGHLRKMEMPGIGESVVLPRERGLFDFWTANAGGQDPSGG